MGTRGCYFEWQKQAVPLLADYCFAIAYAMVVPRSLSL
jgi:hypothetical protein